MSWDKGFNHRATPGYVTDPTNCTYVLITEAYPTTRNSVTFGWTSLSANLDSRDRDTTYPRIAGIALVLAGSFDFQVDLPATGSYDIYTGCGDWASSKLVGSIVFKDNTTTLFTIAHAAATNGLYDATDTDLTGANWDSSNAKSTQVFATTTFIATVSVGAFTFGILDHIFLSQVAVVAAAKSLIFDMNRQRHLLVR